MKMNEYINDFTKHLKEALIIGKKVELNHAQSEIHNVLICGLGGSGIGGTIISDLLRDKVKVPISINKNYTIPNFVNKNTLVIASSYSGNTEETLSALEECQKRGAQISCVTSGGKMQKMAEEKKFNNIIVPAGQPPRAMFGYSFTQLFFLFHHYGLIDDSFVKRINKSIILLEAEAELIKTEAKKIAIKLHKTTPVIYTASGFEGVGVRFRQQINENSKMLCWHQVIPEMNHNELLGWRINTERLGVIFFRNECDHYRNQARIEINKSVISDYTSNIIEVWSKGSSKIENTLYHIHLGDWISWYLSEMNNVDAVEIDVIEFLKNSLAKI